MKALRFIGVIVFTLIIFSLTPAAADAPPPEANPTVCEVYSAEDLFKSLHNSAFDTFIIKKDITVKTSFNLPITKTIIIEEGVTVTISVRGSQIYGQIINRGAIHVTESLTFRRESSEIGDIKIVSSDPTAFIEFIDYKTADADTLKRILAPGSIYTMYKACEGTDVVIDFDLMIPADKRVWLFYSNRFIIEENGSLTTHGKFMVNTDTYPVVTGKLYGRIVFSAIGGGNNHLTIYGEPLPPETYEVFTAEELLNQLKNNTDPSIITIKQNIKIENGMRIDIPENKTVIIDEGVVLEVITREFYINGTIINNGSIRVAGRMCFYKESPEINDISVADAAANAVIEFRDNKRTTTEALKYFLAPDSIYTTYSNNNREAAIVDCDIVIPVGKTLSLFNRNELIVESGATLTVFGKLKLNMSIDPIINGKLIGNITFLRNPDQPYRPPFIGEPFPRTRGVYTAEVFSSYIRNGNFDVLVIKKDINITDPNALILPAGKTLLIEDGVTVSVFTQTLKVDGQIINHGLIRVFGRIVFTEISPEAGDIQRINPGSVIEFQDNNPAAAETLELVLAPDSIFSRYSPRPGAILIIDFDLEIPENKTIYLHDFGTLLLEENASLTVLGKIFMYRSINPVIKGNLIGIINFYDISGNIADRTVTNETKPVIFEVNTAEEYYNNLNDYNIFRIKQDLTLNKQQTVNMERVIIIDEGVTVTVDTPGFSVYGQIVNRGLISVKNYSISICKENLLIGDIRRMDENIDIGFSAKAVNVDLIERIFAPGSVYSKISSYSHGEIIIDRNYTLPEDKKINQSGGGSLIIEEGATLTAYGPVFMHMDTDPVINGRFEGKIQFLLKAGRPARPAIIGEALPRTVCEIYTAEEFSEKIKNDYYDTFIIKQDLTITGDFGDIPAGKTVIISEGVTLDINVLNIFSYSEIINHGKIRLSGVLSLFVESTELNDVEHIGFAQVEFRDSAMPTVETLERIFAPDSVYSNYVVGYQNNILINSDYTLPPGKTIYFFHNNRIIVKEGVTLTVRGQIYMDMDVEPIIFGNLIGQITFFGEKDRLQRPPFTGDPLP